MIRRGLFTAGLVLAAAIALTFLLLPLIAIFLRVPPGELLAQLGGDRRAHAVDDHHQRSWTDGRQRDRHLLQHLLDEQGPTRDLGRCVGHPGREAAREGGVVGVPATTGRVEHRPVGLGDDRVVEQQARDRPRGLDQPAERRRPVVGDCLERAGVLLVDHGERDGLLRAEVEVDGALTDLGGLGDAGDARGAEALAVELDGGGLEELFRSLTGSSDVPPAGTVPAAQQVQEARA